MNIFQGPFLPPGEALSPGVLVWGRFLSRPNRFLVLAETAQGVVRAHCPNPGRLWEIFTPGCSLILRYSGDPGRATAYSLVAAEYDGKILPLHAAGANDITEELVLPALFPGLLRYRREVTVGASRFDFEIIMPGPEGERRILAEVKACTLSEEGLAMFPDAPTERGRRHMEELAELTRTGEAEGHVIFILHHADTRAFMPNFHTDPAFALTMDDLSEVLRFHAVSVSTDREGEVRLVNAGLPVLPAPREPLKKDRGVYLIMLELPEDRTIEVGALGDITFLKGWYVYAGSARRGLGARVERHLRKRKNKRWHIDYLTSEAAVRKGVPIYTDGDLECHLAREVGRTAEREIPGFGCSDCRCSSHLFYLPRSPLASRPFLETLFRFRHRLCFDRPLLIHDLKNEDDQK